MEAKDKFEMFQVLALAVAANKAGSWNKLAKELPISPSHLQKLKDGRVILGGKTMLKLLDYLDLFDNLSKGLKEAQNDPNK